MEQQLVSEHAESETNALETYRQQEAAKMALTQNSTENAERGIVSAVPSVEASQQVEELLETLRGEAHRRKRRRRGITLVLVAYLLLIGTVALVEWRATGRFPAHFGNFFVSINGMVAGLAAITSKQKEATRQIAAYDDVRAVGPLAEALDFRDNDLRRIAEDRLIRLLPRLKASDASLLNTEQMDSLLRALNHKNTELSLNILRALQQVGNETAVPSVERLAQGQRMAARDSRLQVEAQECLSTLITRSENRRNAAQLLRAANGNETPSDMLLRPVSGGGETSAPSELLRVPEIPQ